MSSVALPVPGPAPALGAEADLVRRASRSDEGAFSEIYRRHAQTAWRLAQAVTPSRHEATRAVADGFVRVLRAVRRHQVAASDPFRPLLLAGVYRSAIDESRRADHAATAPLALDPGELSFEAATFRTLPERWRAAIWLSEVEGLAPERVAPILGVSSAVASQLASRGARAMADRYRQAGKELPELVGPALRPLAATLPAALGAVAAAAWRSSVASDTAGRLVPCFGWLGERALQPLRMTVVGVLALGVIGVGVMTQRPSLGDTSPVAGGGAPSATSRAGVNYLNNGFFPIAAFPDGSGLLLGVGGAGGAGGLPGAGGTGAAASASAGATGAAGTTSPLPGTAGGPANGTGGAGGSGGATTPTGGSGGGSTNGGGGATTGPTTTLATGGTTSTGGGLSVTASPSSGISASLSGGSSPTTVAQATVLAPNCTLSANGAGTQVGQTCTTSTTSPSTTTTTAPPLLNITTPSL